MGVTKPFGSSGSAYTLRVQAKLKDDFRFLFGQTHEIESVLRQVGRKTDTGLRRYSQAVVERGKLEDRTYGMFFLTA